MGNPYYIPRPGLVEKLASVTNTANQMQNLHLRPKQLKLGQDQLAETIRSNKATEAHRSADLQARAAAAVTAAQKQRIDLAQTPHHQKPFSMGKMLELRHTIESSMGKGAMKEVLDYWEGAGRTGASNESVLKMSFQNWPTLKQKFIGGHKAHIERQLKDDPFYLDSPEGKAQLASIDAISADKTGDMILPHFFKPTVESMMRERQLHEMEMAKGQPETWGGMQTDQYGNILQRSSRGKLSKVSGPSSRMHITSDKDGNFTFSQGPGAGGGTALPVGVRSTWTKEIEAGQEQLDRINQITSLYEPEFLTFPGKAKGAWATFMNKLNPEQRSQFQQRRAAFISAANRDFLAFRKWATGVAGGEKEMAEIKRATFSEDDSPQDFEAKIELMRSLTRRMIARKKAALAAGVENEAQFKEYIKAHPLDTIPTLQERGDKLQSMGYQKEQVLEILKQEGYL